MRAEPRTRRDRTTPAPWTVWVYGGTQIAGVAGSLVKYELDTASRVASVLLELAIFVGLLRGARLAWIVAIFFQAIGTLGSVGLLTRIGDENALLVSIWVLAVFLGLFALLHPRTREWTSPR